MYIGFAGKRLCLWTHHFQYFVWMKIQRIGNIDEAIPGIRRNAIYHRKQFARVCEIPPIPRGGFPIGNAAYPGKQYEMSVPTRRINGR